jgi:hypothetical protein
MFCTLAQKCKYNKSVYILLNDTEYTHRNVSVYDVQYSLLHCYKQILALPEQQRSEWIREDGPFEKEMRALYLRNVFGPLVDLPKGKKPVGLKWVLMIKHEKSKKL